MTSSILPPRSDLAPCSPITQASASTTLDLPEPLGPTMQVMPGSSCSVVEDAKDLKPLSVRLLRYNVLPWLSASARSGGSAIAASSQTPGEATVTSHYASYAVASADLDLHHPHLSQ